MIDLNWIEVKRK